ncbi:MAG TPA: 2'-5' RNA ligase family protein [Ktedonobacterales bacterium]|nr:2'-5' RNA ligase family protein [Ktedonobacterales bacterium]
MHAIVSLLDDASAQGVRALWAELEREHGLGEVARIVPYPHVSYHLAEDYDLVRIGEAMGRVAERTAPFTARIAGLGAFRAFEPVLYLAVERNPALDALHAAIWSEVAAERVEVIAREPSPLYEGATWVPHATLAQLDLTPEALDALLAAWSLRDFRRDVYVSDLAVLYRRPGEAAYRPIERRVLSGAGGR